MKNNQKTVCFMITIPWLESFRDYYALDAFYEAEYHVILADLSYIYNRAHFEDIKKGKMDYEKEKITVCHNISEVYRFIDGLPEETLMITSLEWGILYYKIIKHIVRKSLKYGYMILNSLYETGYKETVWNRCLGFIRHISPGRVFNSIFIRLPRKWFKRYACNFVINNSKGEIENYKRRFLCSDDTHFLVVHSNSYEDGINNLKTERLIEGKYCVWLDSYDPYHPDLLGQGIRLNSERFYGAYRDFFKWIESNLSIEVVIAAHPKADYILHDDAYPGFRIIKFETCRLVRDAEFVITSTSTSFLYAVLYMKPFLLICNNEQKEVLHNHMRFLKKLGEEFKKTPINVNYFNYNNVKIIDDQLRINYNCYYKCADEYIKNGFNGKIEGGSYKKSIIDFLQSNWFGNSYNKDYDIR